MKDRIAAELEKIERREDVVVLYACESGSRAWGFASRDSDYDVRFIYSRRPEWYLSVDLERKRDVIERPIDDLLDVSGWDLRKALQLFRKSNPPLLEWLDSPIVYAESTDLAEQLRGLIGTYCSTTASGYHYLHMAERNYREFLRGEQVRLKKYFYVMRPVFAVLWLEAGKGAVPMRFEELIDELLPAGELKDAISELTAKKASGTELDRGPKIPAINEFLDRELERLRGSGFQRAPSPPPVEPLNQIFRQTLDAVYGSVHQTDEAARSMGVGS